MMQYLSKCSLFYQNTVHIVLKLIVPYHIVGVLIDLKKEENVSTSEMVSRVAKQTVIGIGIAVFYPITLPVLMCRAYYILHNQHKNKRI
jgi:hypothetical protein